MTLLMIVCDTGLEERVLENLRQVGVPGYTRLTDLTGAGRTGRRDGDPIWPGTNSLFMVVVPEDTIDPVREILLRLKREYTRAPALHVFTLAASELL